jgi:hypothetical protein
MISSDVEMGVARKRQSERMTAERKSVAASSMAFSLKAFFSTGVRSYPTTVRLRRPLFSARPSEPPMSPTPMMVILLIGFK